MCIGGSPACAGRSNGRKMSWYVYILRSSKKRWYYVGSTNNIERRVREHNVGKVKSTKLFTPLSLVFTKIFNTELDARLYEKKLKLKRIEKEAIIREIEQLGDRLMVGQ